MTRPLVVAALAVLAIASVTSVGAQPIPPYVTAAVNDDHRPAADRMRDVNRKPAESIAFAGVKPGDKVVDFLAGGGYFTRILSKVVGPQGHVYATAPVIAAPMGNMPMGNMPMPNMPQQGAMPMQNMPMPGMAQRGMEDPLREITTDPAYANVSEVIQPTSQLKVIEPVDVVWTSQNYHDLHNPGSLHADDMAAFNKSVFDALKPGGVFLVIDYAAVPGTGFTQSPALHRADPEAEKAEILKAGFVFEGESKILARANDPHTMRAHEQDDQFMFRFRKPR